MARYHINPETGRPNICRAKTPDACRFAENGQIPEHYDTKEEARAGYEKEMSEETVSTVPQVPKGESFSSNVAVFVKGDDPDYPEMYRMYATKDVGRYAKPGDKGGLVENPENVRDNAWVGEGSQVRNNAIVKGYSLVLGRSVICDDGVVSSAHVTDTVVSDRAEVSNSATVVGSTVSNDARVRTLAVVKNSFVAGSATVYGYDVEVNSSGVSDNAVVCGEGTVVEKDSRVSGNAHVESSHIFESNVAGDAKVISSAVRGLSKVSENAVVENSVVSNVSHVSGSAQVSESEVTNHSEVCGDTKVNKSKVDFVSEVRDSAVVERARMTSSTAIDSAQVVDSTMKMSRVTGDDVVQGAKIFRNMPK